LVTERAHTRLSVKEAQKGMILVPQVTSLEEIHTEIGTIGKVVTWLTEESPVVRVTNSVSVDSKNSVETVNAELVAVTNTSD
jgi:hypothetical protein